jgi:signal transduction histidine kinase
LTSASSPLEAIFRFRGSDVLAILPMTVIAALGASLWEPRDFVLTWLAVNLCLIGVSQWLYRWLARQPNLPARTEQALAAYTFATTLIYTLLPMAMIARGHPAPLIAGMAMAAAISLSSTSEFVASAMIGSASLLALLVTTAAGLFLAGRLERPLSSITAFIAVACFAVYVVRHALTRQAIVRGLTEARRLAEVRGEEAQAANAAKSTFLATMSHEIRTPMNGVLGMAQAMAASELTRSQRDRLGVLQESAESLLGLLNDVLDFAKIESGKLECERTPFDLDTLLGGATAIFQAQAARKAIILHIEIAEAAHGVYLGDPLRVRQVLSNLISNALKFTETGRIDVTADREGEVLRLVVADTGAGMPADRLDHLFDRFHQLDASTTRKHGGAGLGLAICRELCQLMGGAIAAESTIGQGSTFTATFGLSRIGEPSARSIEARTVKAPAASVGDLRLRAGR